MHLCAAVVVPFHDPIRLAAMTPPEREADVLARIEMLLLPFLMPAMQAWGTSAPFLVDWWRVGGRWKGWAAKLRRRSRSRPNTVPAFPDDSLWGADLARRPLPVTWPLPTVAVLPNGRWMERSGAWSLELSPRARASRAAWARRLRRAGRDHADCLVVFVDCHW